MYVHGVMKKALPFNPRNMANSKDSHMTTLKQNISSSVKLSWAKDLYCILFQGIQNKN